MVFYAIAKGRHGSCILSDWNEAKSHVIGFNGATFKKFNDIREANLFIEKGPIDPIEKIQEKGSSIVHTPNDLVVFTDGSALANGHQCARSGYGVHWPFMLELSGGFPLQGQAQTNNRAEYEAVIHALKQANEIDPNGQRPLYVYTDSMLIINSMTKWIEGWKKKNWTTSSGKDVANIDLVKILDNQISKRKTVIWRHVDAHTGKKDWISVQNDIVDRLARESATKVKI